MFSPGIILDKILDGLTDTDINDTNINSAYISSSERHEIADYFSSRAFQFALEYATKRLLMNFRNKLIFYCEELLAPRPTPKLEDRPLSAVRDCLFNIFAAFFLKVPQTPCKGDKVSNRESEFAAKQTIN
jgi:hypothetical protein